MADDSIPGIRDYFQACGKTAYLAGKSRDSHNLNPRSAGIADFHIGWDSAASSQFVIAAVKRFEHAQECSA